MTDKGTATGWPLDGTDFALWSLYDITIEPGQTSGSVTLTFTVVDDGVDEGNETIVLAGTAAGATVSDAVITIGQPESIALSVVPDTIAEYGGATDVTVTATLSEARAADTVVNLTLGGTASGSGGLLGLGAGQHHHPEGTDRRRRHADHYARQRHRG